MICRLLNLQERQWIYIPNGLKFNVDLRDPYWDRLISPRHHYEPEIDWLLSSLSEHDFCFIDAGANLGYWSCHAASSHYGSKPVFAIEPLHENFELLQQNLKANGLKARCYYRALCEHDRKDVPLYKPGGNASVSIIADAAHRDHHHAWIQTLTLDSLLPELPPAPAELIVKLDIEDAEITALKGASRLLERQPLIIYEDHGQDRSHHNTRYILEELGYKILYYSPQKTLEIVTTTEDAERVKCRRDLGYNFFAFSAQSHWEATLCAAAASS